MVPSPAEVARRRWTLLIVLRCVSFLGLSATVLPLASWISEGLRDGDLFSIIYYWPRIVGGLLPFLFFAFVLMFGRLFVHLVVPLRKWSECPACRYRLEGLVEARCPECGLALSPEFMGQPPARDSGLRRTARVIRTRENVAVVLRCCGVPAAFLGVLFGAQGVSYLFGVGRMFGDELAAWFLYVVIDRIVLAVGCGALAAALIFASVPLARFIVPWPGGRDRTKPQGAGGGDGPGV